jgi:general secretion pathway protein A
VYQSFYGLNRDPFEITADPYFLFPTPSHNEALASIYYGVLRRKGFVVMTGEVGTGKTLLVRCLFDVLRRTHVAFAYVSNPTLSAPDFLEFVLAEFGLVYSNKSKTELLRQFNQYLVSRYQRGLTTTLVVDEAQHLSHNVLEEIRLLTNLEADQRKLLQIILVGQAELEQQLESPDLRQLKQRIALWCHLKPLNQEETAQYIERRLVLAGATGGTQTIFPNEIATAIHRYSGGIPRLINIICDNALIAAYAHHSPGVTSAIVDQIAEDLRLQLMAKSGQTSSNGHDDSLASVVQSLLRFLESVAQSQRDNRSISIGAGVRADG